VGSSHFVKAPDRIRRSEVVVMQHTVPDELEHIQHLWPAFETLVGLRGRKMYAYADLSDKTYTACTPVRDDDHPEALGLQIGKLPGGSFLRGVLTGEPPQLYAQIGDGMAELQEAAEVDASRPLVEFYRRHKEIELWVPILER
jgi:hypothetical protein